MKSLRYEIFRLEKTIMAIGLCLLFYDWKIGIGLLFVGFSTDILNSLRRKWAFKNTKYFRNRRKFNLEIEDIKDKEELKIIENMSKEINQ